MSSVIKFASKLGHGRAARRALLAGMVLAAGWLCLGASTAWADSVIDTTGCTINGRAELSGTPNSSNQLGAEFVAPAGYLTTFAANLASDNPQAVTLALYTATSADPSGRRRGPPPPPSTAPARRTRGGPPTARARGAEPATPGP